MRGINQGEVTNANKDLSTEKAFFEVTGVRSLPLPEKAGKLVRFKDNVVVSNGLTDTVTVMPSVRECGEGTSGLTWDRPNHMKVDKVVYRKYRC